jgi:hypothetical protein
LHVYLKVFTSTERAKIMRQVHWILEIQKSEKIENVTIVPIKYRNSVTPQSIKGIGVKLPLNPIL